MTMDTKALLAEAEALKPQLLTDRRTLHRDPEVGPSLPRTAAYVTERLMALGYTPRPLAGGVVADTTGEDTGRCVLLRADMDALRVREATGLDFQSENGAMHACGHDMHAAMLLGAAALLRKYQAQLNGTVKLVFQPDEEGFTASGALRMGVSEMTRFGFGQTEFTELAGLMADCILRGKDVGQEVSRLRSRYTTMHYCFDGPEFQTALEQFMGQIGF